jgi:hypothetical protein
MARLEGSRLSQHLVRGLRLGRRERQILVVAMGSGLTWAMLTVGATESSASALRRAARRLADAGLVSVRLKTAPHTTGSARYQAVMLTELGRAVVEQFEAELRAGRRIRWALCALPASAPTSAH